ncbi:cell wall-associated NlpC family hydrolase [Sphingomonas naasensis]|uniref:Peptidoglycan endopeptidase n=1 Tax=Sphingomonas naasensis TaxID=1344951 RepID=A0A4S1WGQ0_9SPHN|nr:peptidoglycan endopeptidase [Sphingomonas naasensis]NIJ21629.1 cell wall-associated NlpC family hydrolase [Sphingomonas naasensis]TGX41435.1 peptidoglycan endopeptidase [Sphingomonas naasensis]
MKPGARAVAAARSAVGARFRLHGRDVHGGLDCVGLVALALQAEGFAGCVPSGYALRSGDARRVAATLAALGLEHVREQRPGDLLLLDAGPGQLHFAIEAEAGVIHADAMLRRVVERPDVPWPLIGRWRLAEGG